MIASPRRRLFKRADERAQQAALRVVEEVNRLELSIGALSDDQLRERFADHRGVDATSPKFLAAMFAIIREAAVRADGRRLRDVQVAAGAVLTQRTIAQMRTGEGKTLSGVLPVATFAVAGKGVHVVTANQYLAERDEAEVSRVFDFLGLTHAVIAPSQSRRQKADAYACDITYGTATEFGFDYLRDNLETLENRRVQRGRYAAVVDEADSIFIDEARTPLIIAGQGKSPQTEWAQSAAKLVGELNESTDFIHDPKKRTVRLTAEGAVKAQDWFGAEVWVTDESVAINHVETALQGRALFARDKDYVVADDEVLLVDVTTGRTMAGRRLSEGLHQALEAKEACTVRSDDSVTATTTLQSYFAGYAHLSGMTGTAANEAAELATTYNLSVVDIPTHLPVRRIDQSDRAFLTEDDKVDAIVREVSVRHASGQPVLVGTATVASSERISAALHSASIAHNMLNAKQNASEAEVIAEAGREGAVTVATNMAGRGTDILLGGRPGDHETAESHAAERDRVVQVGGLYVLGTERHESRRVDDQLRGRSGRQGDPGESCFFVSADDSIVKEHFPDLGTERRSDAQVRRLVLAAQRAAEEKAAAARASMRPFDKIDDDHRAAFYRDKTLPAPRFEKAIAAACADRGAALNQSAADASELMEVAATLLVTNVELPAEAADLDCAKVLHLEGKRMVALAATVLPGPAAQHAFATAWRQALGDAWYHHLQDLSQARTSVTMRSYGQKDPVDEYGKEAATALRNRRVRALEQAVATFASHIRTMSAHQALVDD